MTRAVVACTLLLFGCDSANKDNAQVIALAKESVDVDAELFKGDVGLVRLRSRKAVSDVLPLLRRLPHLKSSSILGVPLDEKDVRMIGELNVAVLSMRRCSLQDKDLRFFANLTGLLHLDLANNDITDSGLQCLASMVKLQRLTLTSNRIRGPGLAHLGRLCNLEVLFLTGTPLDDRGMVHCAKFHKLRRLDFVDTQVTDAGLMHLVDLHWLNSISPPDDLVTPEGAMRFLDAFRESKKRARAAGIDVPPDRFYPFGTVEASRRQVPSASESRTDSP